MRNDLKGLILKEIQEKNEITASRVIQKTGFSRAYINKFLQELQEEGKIVQIGQTKGARYVIAEKGAVKAAKKTIREFNRSYENKNLSEGSILDLIKIETGIFVDLAENVEKILEYAFTEILNNAIEHSKSRNIDIKLKRTDEQIRFDVFDRGIGIYNNIMRKRRLKNELEAIQDLLKGKQTTDPADHTGEGVFFTSKVADNFIIRSSQKKLFFNNILEDIFIQDIKNIKGTRVTFIINKSSKRNLKEVFDEYSGESYEFSRTRVAVRLYKMGSAFYVSRSQARRVMNELDKFKEIILDFKHVNTVGQAFTDEIFRVWQARHPNIKIIPTNTDDNVEFMIRHVTRAHDIRQEKLFE